jgi:hypothetical protein
MKFPKSIMVNVNQENNGREYLSIIPDGELVDCCTTGDIVAFYELKFKQLVEKTVKLKEVK